MAWDGSRQSLEQHCRIYNLLSRSTSFQFRSNLVQLFEFSHRPPLIDPPIAVIKLDYGNSFVYICKLEKRTHYPILCWAFHLSLKLYAGGFFPFCNPSSINNSCINLLNIVLTSTGPLVIIFFWWLNIIQLIWPNMYWYWYGMVKELCKSTYISMGMCREQSISVSVKNKGKVDIGISISITAVSKLYF